MSDTSTSNTLIDINETQISRNNKEQKDNLERYVWTSCCFRVNKHVLIFFSQFAIGCMVICFSLYQLNKKDTCEHQQLYIGLLTMIVGVFLPQPRLQK